VIVGFYQSIIKIQELALEQDARRSTEQGDQIGRVFARWVMVF
jgi:hypothetical protein